jgi:hypothetical protein
LTPFVRELPQLDAQGLIDRHGVDPIGGVPTFSFGRVVLLIPFESGWAVANGAGGSDVLSEDPDVCHGRIGTEFASRVLGQAVEVSLGPAATEWPGG